MFSWVSCCAWIVKVWLLFRPQNNQIKSCGDGVAFRENIFRDIKLHVEFGLRPDDGCSI